MLLQYFGGNEADMAKFEQLASEGETVMAIVNEEYTETTIAGVSVYTVDYTFEANGKEQAGSIMLNDEEDIPYPFVEVTYLASDPSVNSTDAPKALAEARESSEGKTDLWIGLAAMLFGFFMAWRGIRALLYASILQGGYQLYATARVYVKSWSDLFIGLGALIAFTIGIILLVKSSAYLIGYVAGRYLKEGCTECFFNYWNLLKPVPAVLFMGALLFVRLKPNKWHFGLVAGLVGLVLAVVT